ncbi:MAG: hypothetical protein HLUCCO17_01925 [Saliniramus fredricksonii]|jgi:hypothetical protein|uniref:Uncharacterized protein n=1 Tax=Saliniramus fredricksonii TaxID=1653334 RepID=A0A0P7Y5G1_9HYPH|nr:hypothetical protein [Saliniramus fredricksonii]KPQ12344.1 MAG: hypothetical protein HLUCCO17_01925 [Saliniramus fredricksonii]SCC81246.1 hypothetical protein GA0071312_2182 [Saliniramus fredricksonii]
MTDRHSQGSVHKAAQASARTPRDQRFGVPDQRSRHAATGRVALALLLCLATIAIAVVASGVNMSDADASGDIERVEERR